MQAFVVNEEDVVVCLIAADQATHSRVVGLTVIATLYRPISWRGSPSRAGRLMSYQADTSLASIASCIDKEDAELQTSFLCLRQAVVNHQCRLFQDDLALNRCDFSPDNPAQYPGKN